MKTFMTTCLIAMASFLYAQHYNLNGEITMENIKTDGMSVSVTVNSASDIEKTFKTNDLKELFEMLGEGEGLSFEMVCESKTAKTSVSKSVSYRAVGNSDEKEEFLKTVGKIRTAAINYYNTKK